MYNKESLAYSEVKSLNLGYPAERPIVPARVYEKRKAEMIAALIERKLDAAVIYGDREHYGNFKYFTGAEPRFEEALLVIHRDGRVYAALGNECLVLAENAPIAIQGVSCQMFSLPNQPMDQFPGMEAVLRSCGLKAGLRLGLIDWKLLRKPDGSYYDDITAIPSYIVNEIRGIVGNDIELPNITAALIAPECGMRIRAEAEAIAAFEFGATCASQSVIDMLNNLRPGMSEMEVANCARLYGQPLSCHTYVVSGENCRRGLISADNRKLQVGDPFTACVGMEGGLTCRSAMVAYGAEDLSVDGNFYMEEIVKPYIATVFNWYEMMGIGVRCGDVFDMVESCIPAEKHGWTLNPGHMVGYEEWMNSPMYKGSNVRIESGMMFQMDIIPSDPVYHGPNAEDGIAIADEALRAQLEADYPDVYARIMERRRFAEEQIGLKLKPEVLPLANSFCEFRPFLLCREKAITIKK